MMKRVLSIAVMTLGVAFLSGCATDMTGYYQAQEKFAEAETARWNAMKEIASNSQDTTVKVAAMFALQKGGGSGADPAALMRAPESSGDTALKWLGVLMPSVTQLGVTAMNVRAQNHASDNATLLGVTQSNNSTAAAVSTNAAFVNLGSAGLNAVTQTAGAGFNAGAAVAGSGFDAVRAGFASNEKIAGYVQAPAANVTTTNNAVNNTTDNHATDSHNTTSNTSTSTASTTSTDSHNSTASTTNTTSTTCSATGAPSGSVTGTTTPTSGTGGSSTTNC